MNWRLPRTANRWMTALSCSWDGAFELHKSEAEIAASTLPELQLAQSSMDTNSADRSWTSRALGSRKEQ